MGDINIYIERYIHASFWAHRINLNEDQKKIQSYIKTGCIWN